MTDEDMVTESDFDEVDREALNRALRMTIEGDNRFHAERLKSELETDGWWAAVTSAVYHQQMENLSLKPSDTPPCWMSEDSVTKSNADGGPATKLLKRLLSYGLSKWEPDPINSINAKRNEMTTRKRSRHGSKRSMILAGARRGVIAG